MAKRIVIPYLAVVLKDDDEFSVQFPDLPGCFTRGATRDQACRFAAETLTAHVERFAADRTPPSVTRCLEALRALPTSQAATLMLVETAALTE